MNTNTPYIHKKIIKGIVSVHRRSLRLLNDFTIIVHYLYIKGFLTEISKSLHGLPLSSVRNVFQLETISCEIPEPLDIAT